MHHHVDVVSILTWLEHGSTNFTILVQIKSGPTCTNIRDKLNNKEIRKSDEIAGNKEQHKT